MHDACLFIIARELRISVIVYSIMPRILGNFRLLLFQFRQLHLFPILLSGSRVSHEQGFVDKQIKNNL